MTILEDILEIIQGAFVCIADNKRYEFASKDEFTYSELCKNYVVTSISSRNGVLVLELKSWQPPVTDMNAEWVDTHKELTGSEPSFF